MQELFEILEQFDLPANVKEIKVISNGFINSTYKIFCEDGNYILQKININVFPRVDALMHNIRLVTEHIYKKTGRGMYVVLTKNGDTYFRDDNDFYRMYNFVENSKVYNSVESPEVFYQAGVGFGRFQNDLSDFDAGKLQDVIDNFHNTRVRLQNFRDAVSADAVSRVASVKDDIAFLEKHADIAGIIVDKLESGELPYRVTHNDTKLNNILFDANTSEPICAIDLDTVMSGSVLYDFGDAIRYGANRAGEAGDGEGPIAIDLELFEAFLKGFLQETKAVLTPAELNLLPEAAIVITYEQALRFLEDHLRGDVYFGAKFEGINLLRARVQCKLLEDELAHIDDLREITKRYI